MLDPELLDELAAHPEKNAPDVNVALAEQGQASVLLALARSAATRGDALQTIARRIEREGNALDSVGDEDDDVGIPVVTQLDELLAAHPSTPPAVLDAVLSRHEGEAWYVLAAAVHPRATDRAIERAARWPARYPVLDRLWLGLITSTALPPLTAEAWAQDEDVLLRELVARASADAGLLSRLARDPSRAVRRAVASNAHAGALRAELAQKDAAPEVRARAKHAIAAHGTAAVGGARFAAALRAMEAGGVLAPDVTGALNDVAALDEEGAALAVQVLPSAQVVKLIREGFSRREVNVGSATGMALRCIDSVDERRELVVDVCKALSQVAGGFGALTGKARFAAWLSEGVAASEHLEKRCLVCDLEGQEIASESTVLARTIATAPGMLAELCEAAIVAKSVSPAMLQVAWHRKEVSDEVVVEVAQRIARAKRRGKDLPEDDLDLDPGARSLDVLEQVILAANRRTTFSPRAALTVVALDARRVRYVLTALPTWRGPLSGTLLSRILRHNAGALKAAKREARSRDATVEPWTARIMSDTEVAVAIALGHYTAEALVARIGDGRHQVVDGVSVAGGAEARASLQGSESVKPLIRWAAQNRLSDGAALAIWLLLEAHDRERPAGMIASAIDSLAVKRNVVSASTSEALATLERRRPGRLEEVTPQTPRGKATLASAIARAYRAVGGLRDEKG
jgi:hypothetical protein